MQLFWICCGMFLSAVQVPQNLCCPSWFLFQWRGLYPAVCQWDWYGRASSLPLKKSTWGWSLRLPHVPGAEGWHCVSYPSYICGSSVAIPVVPAAACSAAQPGAWHPGFWYTWTCWFHWESISVRFCLTCSFKYYHLYLQWLLSCLEMCATFQLCGMFHADVPLLLQLPI